MLAKARLLGLIALVLTSACRKHVALLAPQTSPGSLYSCEAVAGGGDSVNQPTNCKPATVDVPAEMNKSGTTYFVLPNECKGRFNKIIIHDAESSKPTVTAVCAPEEQPITVMPK